MRAAVELTSIMWSMHTCMYSPCQLQLQAPHYIETEELFTTASSYIIIYMAILCIWCIMHMHMWILKKSTGKLESCSHEANPQFTYMYV